MGFALPDFFQRQRRGLKRSWGPLGWSPGVLEASGKGPKGLLGALGAVKEVPGGLGRFGGPLGDL